MQSSETVLEDQEDVENAVDETESLGDDSEKKDNPEEIPKQIEEPKDPEQVFQDKLNSIRDRLLKIPDDAEELKLPEVKLDSETVYLRLCKALEVPLSSTFLRNIDSDAMDFSYQSLGKNGIVAVTKGLVSNTSVNKLDFSYNSLGSVCLPAITSLLNQNEHISHLNLSNNNIGKYRKGVVGELVSVCHSVEVLDLSGNSLGDDELVEIGKSLQEIDSVKDLNLSWNDFGPTQGPVFGSCIAKCSALEKLNLSNNRLEEGVTTLFSSLKNSNLKHLNLSRNGIVDDATPPLGIGLKNSKALVELDLTGNYITEKGVKPVAAGLKGSSCLEIMRLALNPINPTGAAILVKSIGASLRVLDLTGIRGDVLFMKTLRKAPETAQVLFGPEVRFGIYPAPRYRSPRQESITPSNVLAEMQKLADDKGVSLRHTLLDVHASFLANLPVPLETAEAEEPSTAPEEPKVRLMQEKEFAATLSEKLGAPKSLALEMAAALSDEDGMVNFWDLITKVQWRPDDVAVRIKIDRPPPPDKKDKGKKK